MALGDAFPGVSGGPDSVETRKALAGLVVRDTSGNARPGIFPRHANSLLTARADMKVDVGGFEGISVRGGGPNFMANDGVAQSPTLSVPVANSILHVVYFKQNESASPFSDANNLPIFGVLSSGAAPIPTKPDVSTVPGAVELGTVLVPSGVTATNQAGVVITGTHQFTSTTGGTVWFRNTTERDVFTTAVTGQRALVLADKGGYVSDGAGAWALPGFPHAEFATTVSIANAVDGTMGTLTADTSRSVNGGFVTSPSAGKVRLQPGIYSITLTADLPTTSTGTTLLGLRLGVAIIGRTTFPPSSSSGMTFTYPNYLVTAANTDLELYLFQTTGATRTVPGRVAITKLS